MKEAEYELAGLKTSRGVIPGILLAYLLLTTAAYGFEARFVSGESALAIPFELIDDHIYLRVPVNGSPPLSFILDTGASRTILSLRNAKSFGMELQPVGKVEGGIGAEPPDAYLITDAVSFSLPGVVLSDESVVALSLDNTQECLDPTADAGRGQKVPPAQRGKEDTGRVVDGILGKTFFSSFVVEIDYAGRLINLYAPLSYKYTGRGKSLPLEMDPRYIFARVQVKAPKRSRVTARLVVDTGAGTLSLTKQFAEAHKLLPPAEKLTASTECGINGSAKEVALVGTLEALQLGGFKLSNPLTVFYQKTTARDYDGLLGGSALRNFKVIFDYSRGRMILEPPRRGRRSLGRD
jgi:predicted aspartyl protease